MSFLAWGRNRRRRLPPLLKCVFCQQRPGETYHDKLPLCKRCKQTLRKQIEHDGGAILKNLESLRSGAGNPAALRESIARHAQNLIPYQDCRLRTTDPVPSDIIHRVKSADPPDWTVTLFQG